MKKKLSVHRKIIEALLKRLLYMALIGCKGLGIKENPFRNIHDIILNFLTHIIYFME